MDEERNMAQDFQGFKEHLAQKLHQIDDAQQEERAVSLVTLRGYTVDEMVRMWLHAKASLSGSQRTKMQYENHITKFRALLHEAGIDLNSADEATIAALAQGYAAYSFDGHAIAGATYNQRRAAISSFYRYAIKHRWLATNPMELVEPRTAHYNNAALPIARETVKAALKSIDRKTIIGKRDYAILSILFDVGRRVSELCDMKCGDVSIAGETVTITWPRTKGGKLMRDQLSPEVTVVFLDYLTSIYGNELQAEAPVWISFSRFNGKKREAIGTQAIAAICEKYLHVSKVHATRHSFALFSEAVGAPLSEIGARLGHASLATTSTYMKRLHSAENRYASPIAQMLGIGE